MNIWHSLLSAGGVMALAVGLLQAAPEESFRNDQVVVRERTLAPGATLPPRAHPAVLTYLNTGAVESNAPEADAGVAPVKRGDVVFRPAGGAALKNRGEQPLRVVVTEFLGGGSAETWGATGLSPHYTLLLENPYTRVYDIRIPAGTSEPRHSHHDRIVVCLSGAELMHELPDGRKEPSTLTTGQIAWRRGGTHVGHNLGKTDLWVIAIEPK